MRFELTQPFGHYPLKVACLPIPPPGHECVSCEIRGLNESEKRDSNPRPQPWQGCALPTELFSRMLCSGLVSRGGSPPFLLCKGREFFYSEQIFKELFSIKFQKIYHLQHNILLFNHSRSILFRLGKIGRCGPHLQP